MRHFKSGALGFCLILASLLAEPADAAIQFQGFSEAFAPDPVSSITVPSPAGTSPGDLLIAAVATDSNSAGSLSAPIGWTVLDIGTGGGAVTLGVWWKLASGAEPPSHDFTWSGTEDVYGWIMRFTGHDQTVPIDAFSVITGSSSAPTSPSVLTTVNSTLVLRLGAFDDDDINVGVTGLAGHTDITMQENDTGAGTTSAGAGYVMQPVAGPSGTSAFALTGSEEYRTLTLAIRPAITAVSTAEAEVAPNTVANATTANTFTYDIFANIGALDTGVDEITITVPSSFGLPAVTDVNAGGVPVAFTDNTSGHVIRISLSAKVTATDIIQIVFDADAPSCPDAPGKVFTSTVDDTATIAPPQNTVEGDGNQDGGGDGDSWRVITTGTACWFDDTGYQYRKEFCLDGTQIAGMLTDFPVLVSFTDLDLSKALANGFDIIITDEDGVTKLDHERVFWDRATGKLSAWVRFPTLMPGPDKKFYIYYGNPGELVDQQNPPSVWDPDYKAVWHLEESGNGTLDEFADSTANANHGQGGDGSAADTPAQMPAVLGNAQLFDGSGDFVAIQKVEDDFDVNRGTMSAWFTLDPGTSRVVVELRANVNNHLSLWWDDATGEFRLLRRAGGSEQRVVTTALTEDSTWHLATLTWDTGANEIRGYLDGLPIGTQAGLGTWAGALNGLGSIGVQPSVGRPFSHEGMIDEVRISGNVRSAEWTATCYNNQASPATFLKCIGPEESLAASTATISSSANRTFTVGFPTIPAARIIVTDTTGGTVTDAGDLRLRIPAGFNMRWDSAVASVGLLGSAAGKVNPTVKAYEDADRTVVLDVTSDFAVGEFVDIDSLQFTSFTAPSPLDNLELELGNDGVLSAIDDKTILILPAVGPTLSSEYDQVFTLNETPPPLAATLYITQGTLGAINTTNDIIIRIPAAYPILWDVSVPSVVIGGTGAGKVSTSVSYEVGDQGVILDVTAPLAPGEFITVSGLFFTTFSAVALPTNLELEVGVPTVLDDKTIEVQGLIDVAFFTATATDFKVELEWVSPPFGNCVELIVARRLGALPTPLVADWFNTPIPCPAPGTKMSTVDAPPANDVTYDYAIFVHDGVGGYSKGQFLQARPFDSVTGRVKWAYSTAASAMAPPGLRFSGGGATVYAVSNDNVVHAMRGGATGGTWPVGWKPFQLGAPAQARPPVVPFTVGTATNGVAFVGSQDGKVYAVNADDGSETWSQTLAKMVQAAPAGNFVFYNASAQDVVLVGTRNSSGSNTMEALNVADGAYVWSFDNSLGQGGDGKEIGIISGSASVDYTNRRVIFASRRKSGGSSNTVWCVDFSSGSPQLLWANNVGDVDGSPVLFFGVVYVGTNAGDVYALDAATGKSNWLSPVSPANGPIKWFPFPQFGSSNLFVSSTDNVYSIADGGASGSININWPMTTIPLPSTPLHVPGTTEVMVGGGNGRLYQLDVTNSIPELWVTLGDGLAAVGMPTMDLLNLMIYVGTDAGVIYGVKFPLP